MRLGGSEDGIGGEGRDEGGRRTKGDDERAESRKARGKVWFGEEGEGEGGRPASFVLWP